jgi:GMP synthase (glutamine-hydrolysing)
LPDILIVKTGTTDADIVKTHGDYDDWFLATLPAEPERIKIVHAYKGDPLPDTDGLAGIILTGSVLSVTDGEEWMLPLGRWAVSAADNGIPVLAVCFGHQLVGEVLGAPVVVNRMGLEVGAVDVVLSESGQKDLIFDGLPRQLDVQASHNFVVSDVPPRADLLASNVNTGVQAFGYGENLRAVQFHPEISSSTMERLLSVRGYNGLVRDSGHGIRILQNWITHWVNKT